jgi:hypothetical protein
MSWTQDLLDASFRGVPLNILMESVDTPRAIASNGVPYRDGQDSEDMGRDSRVVSMRLAVFGPGYAARLQATIAAFEAGGPGELVHPIYGPLIVLVSRHSVEHDASSPDYAEITAVFVEQRADRPLFTHPLNGIGGSSAAGNPSSDWRRSVRDLLSAADSLSREARRNAGGAWSATTSELLALPGIGLRLGQMRAHTSGTLADIAGLSGAVGTDVDPFVVPERLPAEVGRLCRSLIPRRSNGTVDVRRLVAGEALMASVPGRDLLPGAVVRVWGDLLAAARSSDDLALARLDCSWVTADPAVQHAAGLMLVVSTEHAVAFGQAVVFLLDEHRNSSALMPADVERMTQQACALYKLAIDVRRAVRPDFEVSRATRSLKGMISLLLTTSRLIADGGPLIVSRRVTTTTCVRALAHAWYGDHGRAVELLRLNPTLRRPYDISPGTELSAYAS